MSLFISFEGSDGSGKSTQAALLYRRLQAAGRPVILTHEPGGTALGERVAALLKWSRNTPITPLTEILLFNASRSQLVATVIRPALDRGEIVIADRFTDSTAAYQSYGRGLPLSLVAAINDIATGGLKPDLTILIDVPVKTGLKRKPVANRDNFEAEDILFHERVRQGYLEIARAEPARFLIIDGTCSIESSEILIWNGVRDRMRPAEYR